MEPISQINQTEQNNQICVYNERLYIQKNVSQAEIDGINIMSQHFQYHFLKDCQIVGDNLLIPYTEGKTLDIFLDDYKNEDQQTNPWNDKFGIELPIMSFETFLGLIRSLSELSDLTNLLNSQRLYVNSISTESLIVTNLGFIMNDFKSISNRSIVGSNLFGNSDKIAIANVFKDIICTAIYDDFTRRFLLTNGIIIFENGFVKVMLNFDYFKIFLNSI